MRVMGLTDLVLVAPRDREAARHPDALALASGASDVLERCRCVASLEDALADVSFAVAVSAAPREFGPPALEPHGATARALAELAADDAHHVAFVFGTERTGLLTEHVLRCQALLSIPGAPDYNSLNLAQAVQIVAWELRKAAMAGPGAAADGARMATGEQVERLFAHLEQALVAVRFLDPEHPKKLMPRLRRLFSRARLEVEEVELLRGVCKQMLLAAQQQLPPPKAPGESPLHEVK